MTPDHLCRVPPQLVLYAARYARGRETAAPHDVLDAIVHNADQIREHSGCRQALIRELGDEWLDMISVTDPSWGAVSRALDALET